MNSLVRNLDIYDIIGIGDSITIELYNMLNKRFSNLSTCLSQDGTVLNYLYNNAVFMNLDLVNNLLYVTYFEDWAMFDDTYEIYQRQTHEVIKYFMRKYYNNKQYSIMLMQCTT